MNRHRISRLERIAKAQEAIAESAARSHARAITEHEASREGAADIVASLNTENPLHGLLTGLMASALTRNAAQTQRLEQAAERTGSDRRVQSVRAEALRRRADAASHMLNRDRARRELEALVSKPARPASTR